MKVKSALSLFLLALFLASFADAAPPGRCDQYAKEALAQLRHAREMQLPVSGPVWSDNYQAHYTWCLGQTENTLVQGSALRQAQLEKAKNTAGPAVTGDRTKTGASSHAASSGRCDQYAREALTQVRYARQMRLPASGPEWSDNYQIHYTWCLGQTENTLVQGSSLRQTQIEKARQAAKYGNNGLPGGSASGSGSGMAGPPQTPGGITWPGGSGDAPPLFGDGEGDIPGIADPTGMGRPGDKIVTPDKMGEHTPGGSYGNLYGGVNPARDPRGGGGRGKDPNGYNPSTMSGAQFNLVFTGVNNPAIDWVEKDTWNGTTTFKAYWDGGKLYDSYAVVDGDAVYMGTYDSETGEKQPGSENRGETFDGAGNVGNKNPLSEEDRQKIKKARLDQAYEEITSGPAVNNDGGVVDPARNQARGDGNAGGSGKGSAQAKAPVAAKPPNSQKPGSLLTGGGRIDTDKPSAQVKPPQGFQVIDPPARQGEAAGRVK